MRRMLGRPGLARGDGGGRTGGGGGGGAAGGAGPAIGQGGWGRVGEGRLAPSPGRRAAGPAVAELSEQRAPSSRHEGDRAHPSGPVREPDRHQGGRGPGRAPCGWAARPSLIPRAGAAREDRRGRGGRHRGTRARSPSPRPRSARWQLRRAWNSAAAPRAPPAYRAGPRGAAGARAPG